MKRLLVAGVIALAAMVAMPQTAAAVPFTGAVDYIGVHTPDNADMNLATESTIAGPGNVGDPVVVLSTGSFAAHISVLDPLTHESPLEYRPFGGPYTPLWSHSSGITFDLLTLSIQSSSSTTLVLVGTGEFKGAGFDTTPGNWNMTLNIATGQVSGSFSSSSSVPEPGVLALFGLGLLGVARRYTRR